MTVGSSVGAAVLGLVAASVLGACGSRIVYTPTNTPAAPLARKQPDQVQVFSTQVPNRPYIEVGLLEASRQSTYSLDDETAVLEKLRATAAEHGCDALLITGSADRIVVDSINGNTSGGTLKGYKGTCLVWTGQAPAPAQSTPAAMVSPARCVPGESRACVGRGGCQGGQACSPDGASYAPCDCGGDAAPPATAGAQPSSPPK